MCISVGTASLHYTQLLAMSVSHCTLYLILLFITSLLLPPSTAYCPEKFSYKTCHQLHHSFERALLASSENQYKLREEYFPSSGSSPVYGHVGYAIHHNYLEESNYTGTRACDKDNVRRPQFLIEHSRCIPWSSYAILVYIDPMFLNSFQLRLLDMLLQNAGAVAVNLSDCGNQHHSVSSLHVHLNLTLELHEDLPCMPSEAQMHTALADLTSWLKAYAVSQNTTTVAAYPLYKGFSSTEGANDLQWKIYAIYTLFGMLMVVVMGLGAPLCYKWIAEKANNERNQWYSFFWAASLVATLCNAAILGFEIKFFFDTVSYNNLNPFKLAFVVFFCLLDMTIAKYVTECYEENTETQQPYDQPLECITTAQGAPTTAQGAPTTAQGAPTTAQGPPTTAQGPPTTAQGPPTTAQGPPTTAQGPPTTAQGAPTTAQGAPTTAQGAPTTVQGPPTTAQGAPTTAQGAPTTAQGAPTTAQGAPTTAQGGPATAQGVPTIVQGAPTTAQGAPTTAQGASATAQGPPPTAQGAPPTAQGAPSTTPFQLHVPKAAVILSRCFCCTIFCSKRNQEVHICTLALWSLMFFVHLLSLASLPTIIWVTVLPLRVISLLTATCAAIFCVTAFVAVLISIPTQLQSNSVYKVLLLLTIPALSSAIVVLGSVLYLQLIMNSIDTISVAGIIVSFLPSAGLTIVGWVVTGFGVVRAEGGDATLRMEEGLTSSHDATRHIHNPRRGGLVNFIVRRLPWRRISHHPTSPHSPLLR